MNEREVTNDRRRTSELPPDCLDDEGSHALDGSEVAGVCRGCGGTDAGARVWATADLCSACVRRGES